MLSYSGARLYRGALVSCRYSGLWQLPDARLSLIDAAARRSATINGHVTDGVSSRHFRAPVWLPEQGSSTAPVSGFSDDGRYTFVAYEHCMR